MKKYDKKKGINIMRNLTVNYNEQKIIMSHKFAKSAETVGSAEYLQLIEVKDKFPNYSIVIKPKQTSSVTSKYGNLKYEDMINRINSMDNEEKREEIMTEFNKVRACGKYFTVRSWFIQTVILENNEDESAA